MKKSKKSRATAGPPDHVIVKFGRKRWKVNRYRVQGFCDSEKKEISVDPDIDEASDEFLRVCLHEALHFLDLRKSETRIDRESRFILDVINAARQTSVG